MNKPKAGATRTERDSFGPIEVPADHYWGAQTQRALQNFRIGGETMPPELLRALAWVKRAAATVNHDLGMLESRIARAIVEAADEVLADPEAALYTTTPGLDIRAHQQASLYSRLFQS